MVVVIKPQFVAHEDDKGRSTTIFSLDVSPDGSRLATAGLDQKIKIWNTQPLLEEHMEEDENCKKLLSTLGSHNGNVLCVRWSPDGQYLASGSDDMVAIVWEKDENGHGRKVFGQVEENHEVWKPVRRLVGHESDIMALAWSNDGYWLATGGSDRLIFVWDAQTFAMVKKINFHGGMVKGIAFDPAGELMTTQSDDRSVCVWRTTDWSLLSQLKEPFVDSPNASWFRRLSWSPEGTFLAIPNSVNNGVFVAGILKRKHWDQATSLVGHENVVDVSAFNPLSFVKNANKPGSGQNLCAVLAIAARNCISVWLTSQVRPIVVFDTIVDREILDLSWSRDGTTLYACSSEGRIAVMHFRLPELGNVAPSGSRESFLETWKFKRPARTDLTNGNGSAGGTAGKPNMLMARKGKNAGRPASTALLPIPPAGAPQNITINKDGKRRIQPAFLGLGGIVAQPLRSVTSTASNATSSASATVYAPPIQPTASTSSAPYQPTPSMAGVQSYEDDDQSADDRPLPNGHGPQQRTSLQGIGVPSWGAPQDRPVQHAQYNNKKRKVADLDYDGDNEPANLAPYRPPGRTLGGDRQFAPYDGELVEIMPAYIPETVVQIPQETLKLAVPATQAYQSLKWDKEDEEADKLEVRNYESDDRPSEVAQINAKGKPEWLDYVPSAIVMAAFSPYFAAISCQNQTLHVYSPSGRRLFPALVLDAPCSYLDAAGHFLLAITARGTLAVWDVRKRKATFRPTSVLPIVDTATDKSRKTAVIVSAKVRPNGHPIIALSNGSALTFDGDLESWTEVSTTWWSKGSDCWEARSRASTKEARGVVRIMESEANDFLVAQQKQDADFVMVDEDEEVKPSVEGAEQAKLGNGEDWKMALTLGHLESRMAAAIVLDSLAEYKTFLSLYVRKLAEEAFRAKAEELVKELLGPIYHRPGREDNWQPHLLGVHKHTLLRDVTSIWGKSKNFSKLATETNDTLKKMLADA